MFYGPQKRGRQSANPFKQEAAGIGANRLFTSGTKALRYANQALGDTPPRDGPFAASAKPLAVALPPKTRARVRRNKNDPGGINPFR